MNVLPVPKYFKRKAFKKLFTFEAHCNPLQGQYRARTGFSLWSFPHREKHVFITGNSCSYCRDPCFHYRDFPVRKLHRENPVFITGNGFAVSLIQERLQFWGNWLPKVTMFASLFVCPIWNFPYWPVSDNTYMWWWANHCTACHRGNLSVGHFFILQMEQL